MTDNELIDALLAQDSSSYMDGSHNWVLNAHPEAERRGKITAHVPWQAWYLLQEAAARIRELSAENDVLRAEIERLKVRLSDGWYDDIGERCDRLEAENERLRIAIVEHQAANATPHCDDDACPRGCGNDRKLYAAIDNP